MLRKLFCGLMAAGMLLATSCQQQELTPSVGEEAVVTINVGTPEIATRAFSDGKSATHFQYAVYDETGKELQDLTVRDGEIHGSTTVRLKLKTGGTYSILFWAAAQDAPYDVNLDNATMVVDYSTAVSNDESRDAFYYYVQPFEVTGSASMDVEMRRPFAQLNIGTADYGDAASAGFIPTESYVKVPVYSKLNFATGEVMGEATSELFDYAAIPTAEAFPVTGYEYLAMNYLLVPASKETIEVEFGYNNKEGNGEEVRKVGAVPVQRNHRTNIYGNLMTSTIDIHVEINPEYDEPAYELDHVVFDALGLQEALNAAPAGATTTIHLGADIKGDVIEYQKADRHIVIEGGNHKYDGTIKIHNGSNYNNGSITINEVNFETEATQLDFILAKDFGKEGNVTRRYSNNIFVTNCSFVALTANEGVVGVQVNATRNLQVLNCTANGLHSLVQAQSCGEDVIVKEAEIEGGKNGIAFKQVKNVVVEDVTIVAAAYGIRFDGNVDNYGITVKNVNVDAVQPFIVRKMTGKNNTIALEGTNTLTTTEAYQIVITNGSDDEAYAVPTGSYTLSGEAGFNVYPVDASAAALQAAINNSAIDVINLENTITSVGLGFEVNRDLVFNMNNEVFNAGSTANSYWYALEIRGTSQVEINDANFTRAGVFAGGEADVVFNSGIINHKPERTSRYIFCANEKSTITIIDGTFNNDRAKNSYFWADAEAIIYVKGGNFGGVVSNNKVVTSNGGQVIISGGTFNFDPTAWLAAGYKAVKSGSTWTVVEE